MPSVTLHLLFADRVLNALKERGDPTPFDTRVPEIRNAFRQGALGPDLGYFPGGHRFLSDLAHCVASADLTRTLVRGAKTAMERAFAWGWATHVLADQRLHPWIGRAVGQWRTGDPSKFVSGDEDPVGHVRIETGLDAWISHQHGEVSRVPLRPFFDAASIQYLSLSYRRSYGVVLHPKIFLTSHEATTRMGRRALSAVRAMGRELAGAPASIPLQVARGALRGMTALRNRKDESHSVALAYLTPVRPETWLVEETEGEIEAFPRRFLDVADRRFEKLENRNLDTGEPDSPWSGHSTAERTVRTLRAATARNAIPAPAGK